MNRQEIFEAVNTELNSANEKFPKFNSYHEGYAVIHEELDELWDEVKKKSINQEKWKLKSEAIQVAAMAIKFIESFDL